LEYLSTHNTAEICNKYGIHQNQLYRWRDEFLSNAHKAFEVNGITSKDKSYNWGVNLRVKKNGKRNILRRRKSIKPIERNKSLLERIKELKQEHPFWGYRRIWAYLRYREGLRVNKKRIYRLMKEENLLVSKDTRLKARRSKYPYKSKPKPTKPNQVWGIDMTKILIPAVGWVYFQVVLERFAKKIVGYSLSFTSKACD
jgi:transposase-like protein